MKPCTSSGRISQSITFEEGPHNPYVWVGRSLGLRRCSTILGMAAPVIRSYQAGQEQKRKRVDKEFEDKYNKEVQQLREEFAGVGGSLLL